MVAWDTPARNCAQDARGAMTGLLIFLGGILAVGSGLGLLEKLRAVALGRGIGAAGDAYNRMHGYGGPDPETPVSVVDRRPQS